jgi:hypothetical protein
LTLINTDKEDKGIEGMKIRNAGGCGILDLTGNAERHEES